MYAANISKADQDTASWEASISSWVDGEGDVRPEELDTPYGRATWDTYHLIGDVLRNPDLAIKPSERFYARVSKAIDEAPHIVAPRLLHKKAPMRWGLSGLAVAAAVAAVAWIAIPNMAGGPASTQAPMMASARPVQNIDFVDYLNAHREMSGAGTVHMASFEVAR